MRIAHGVVPAAVGALARARAVVRGVVGHDASESAGDGGRDRSDCDRGRRGVVVVDDDCHLVRHGGASGLPGERRGVFGTVTDRRGLGSVGVPARPASALGGSEQQALRGGRLCE